MKNISVYIISAIIAGIILFVYGHDLMGYGMSVKSIILLCIAIIIILIIGIIIAKICNKKLDSKK